MDKEKTVLDILRVRLEAVQSDALRVYSSLRGLRLGALRPFAKRI